MTEAQIVNAIMSAIGARPGLRIWRNNTGALMDRNNRLVRYGLTGSADILGVMAPHGRLLAIECKTAVGRLSHQQLAFGEMVRSHGGLFIVARSVEDVMAALDSAN